MQAGGGGFDGGSGSAITVDLTGDSAKSLDQAAADVIAAIKGIEGVEKVTSNQNVTKPGYSITVDPALAKPQEIAGTIRSLMNPTPIGSMKLENKEIPVVLDALINPTTVSDLSNIQIMTASGSSSLDLSCENRKNK